MLTSIVVPLDGSRLSEAALPYAERLARRTSARLTPVRVVHRAASPSRRIVEETLKAVADADADADALVVMATHDRVGPDRWVHGSVAEEIVNRAPVPVMLVRATPGPPVAYRFNDTRPVLIVPLDASDLAEAGGSRDHGHPRPERRGALHSG